MVINRIAHRGMKVIRSIVRNKNNVHPSCRETISARVGEAEGEPSKIEAKDPPRLADNTRLSWSAPA